MTHLNIMARYAERYIERFGFPVIPTVPGRKGPRFKGWQKPENAIRCAVRAAEYWRQHPHDGIAVVLGHIGYVSVDIDDEVHATTVLTRFGLDLQELKRTYPCIVSRPGRCRLMFSRPADVQLHPRTLRFPRQDDPRKRFVVLEYRCGAQADTLPPTIHPVTGRPYVWLTPPRNGFPELPDRMLELWQDWEHFERTALSLCPWYMPPAPKPARESKPRDPNKPSVIAEFNKAHNIGALLEQHGYQRRGKRFIKPKTSHSAGLVLLDDGHVYCHHAGDVLGDAKPHDAFDLFVEFEHGGNFRAAVKVAAELLELNTGRCQAVRV